jgi:HK97 family phage major capsid protein
MAYDKMITRENASALQADQKLINEIITGVTAGSTILPLMRKLPNMTGKTASIPVLSSLPEAYWVDGDNGLKQTTSAMWKNKKITAEEIAVVVPIPEAVLADSEYDIWAEIKPQIVEQFYKKIDEAIISGKDKPTSFREGLIPSIVSAGNTVSFDADATTYERISDAMSKVEEDGFDVTGILGGVALKGAFRKGLVDSTGQPLANSDVTELPRAYARNGAWDSATADFVVGDFKQAVYAIRQDIEFKLFDSGVVTDSEGNIIYNLMQQDMVALRVTMRMGWELPNPVTGLNGDEATRFPFALAEKQA